MKYPEPHPIRDISTLTPEEKERLLAVDMEIGNLKRKYKADLKRLEEERKKVLEVLKSNV